MDDDERRALLDTKDDDDCERLSSSSSSNRSTSVPSSSAPATTTLASRLMTKSLLAGVAGMVACAYGGKAAKTLALGAGQRGDAVRCFSSLVFDFFFFVPRHSFGRIHFSSSSFKRFRSRPSPRRRRRTTRSSLFCSRRKNALAKDAGGPSSSSFPRRLRRDDAIGRRPKEGERSKTFWTGVSTPKKKKRPDLFFLYEMMSTDFSLYSQQNHLL